MKKEWCIPPKQNAEFVCNMEDVLDVYQRQYDRNCPVVCMDESSKQRVKETRLGIPLGAGQVECFDTEYERNGVSNLFMFCEPLKGWRRVKVTDRRTKRDWAMAMKELADKHYADAEKIVVIMDNLNTHSASSFYEAFAPEEAQRLRERFEFHYTPKHGSWLNIAEIEFSILSRQCLDRRIPDQQTLVKEVAAWNTARNNQMGKVDWQFTTQDARIKLKKLYPSLLS